MSAVEQEFWEAGQQLAAVAELRQYDLAALHGQRAGAVAVVVGDLVAATGDVGSNIVGHDRRLHTGCRCGFGVGGIHHVAQRPDVGVGFMAQCALVDIHPAGLVYQWAVANKVGCDLRRYDVNHVELAADFDIVTSIILGGKPCGLVGAVDAGQRVAKVELGLVFVDVLHQRGHVIGHAEQHRTGVVEFHIDVVQTAFPIPVVAGQVQRLLRCAGAFDGHGGLGKQRLAAFEVFHQLPSIGRQIVAVVGGHPVLAQRFAQAFDGAPVELDPGGHYQPLVVQQSTAFQNDRVVVGIKCRYCRLDPFHAFGDQRRHAARSLLGCEYAAADQRPAGLIIVSVGGVDNGDGNTVAAFFQAGGGRDASRAATDNQHVVGRHALGFRAAVFGGNP